jgi:hypothetical protein
MSDLFVIGFVEAHKVGPSETGGIRRPSPHRERVLEELHGIGGKVLKTSLSHEDAAILQAALSAARR